MILKNKYVFGCLVQFYELEMLDEHIQSIVQMIENVENKENLTFHFTFNLQDYYEKIDVKYFQEKFNFYSIQYSTMIAELKRIFDEKVGNNGIYPANLIIDYKTNQDDFYNIADHRRDLCNKWCKKVDLVCWSETDSLWPKQTLELLELLHDQVKDQTPKYVVNFADRRLWDNSFAPLHPMFENESFKDDPEWQFNNESSGKAYMSLDQMNQINDIKLDDVIIDVYDSPRFDGSCVCFSSDLIKSGVTVPHGILLSHEDSAMGQIAKKIMGSNFVQYCFKNILHVHNRRHPNKRKGILNEDNAAGFGDKKGDWWTTLEQRSKENLNNLFTQTKFNTL